MEPRLQSESLWWISLFDVLSDKFGDRHLLEVLTLIPPVHVEKLIEKMEERIRWENFYWVFVWQVMDS